MTSEEWGVGCGDIKFLSPRLSLSSHTPHTPHTSHATHHSLLTPHSSLLAPDSGNIIL
ncbi:hypothetical protein [Chroococcidiopsis sp.]|uniref:hypothetical protein n=1 Tax=Chroococcidiopsis sp. TaxID=3088168 RepID=UPI003F2F4247